LAAQLGRFGNLAWAASFLLADAPTKIEFGTDTGEEPLLADNIAALIRSARREVLIVSPYFVPGQWGMDLMREVRERGVRVRVLTNSLAATDVPIVHAGYARYRVELLQLGIDLYELRPLPARPRGWLGLFGSSRASLHAKAVVVDGRVAFVGTLNLDPRSIRLNTEMGIVFDSTALSAQLAALFEQSASPENSFRPRLQADGFTLEWTAAVPGGQQRYETEPDADASRMLIFRVLGPLAPEALL
jgi:phosphatidylserine/phosphatidylglycerophosphate/cardiolipin synthase-like enzyme